MTLRTFIRSALVGAALLSRELACGPAPCVALREQGASCPTLSGYADDGSCARQCEEVRQVADELACLAEHDERDAPR